MMHKKSLLYAALFSAAHMPLPAQSYDMDCKLILCIAGGFPANCGDARSYMISRITALPPKPPIGFCAFEGGSYDNYDLDYGALGFVAEAFRCPDGAQLRIDGTDKGPDANPVAFCYEQAIETCIEERSVTVCETDYLGKSEPLQRFEYFIDLTLEPGSAAEYRSGRMLVDFNGPAQ